MRLSLFQNIFVGFLAVTVGLFLSAMVALTVLGRVADRLEEHRVAVRQLSPADTAVVAAEEVRSLGDLIRTVHRGQTLVLLFGLSGLLGGLVAMVVASGQAASLLQRLKEATRQLANVVLDEEPPVAATASMDNLELEIREMMRNIQASQRLCLDASPLTRLPGNRAIEQVLKEKMARDERFALCYVDLDDFKAYNDKYGYARGSELIKLTGEIIYRAKDRHADTSDFVGHIGGDDFVLIVASEHAPSVCESIIAEFDRVIPDHYDEQDRSRGYIECLDRYGVVRQFPLMTISIAVVSDSQRQFRSPIEIARIATEIKDYVKTLPGSNYLIDRRVSSRSNYEN
jgi:GGDEF domain-containing protein